MIVNTSPQVNSVSITVSVHSAESPGLTLILEGKRRELRAEDHPSAYRAIADLVVELWGDR
jgi:hypothetical protein